MKKRLLSVFLTIAMIITMLPLSLAVDTKAAGKEKSKLGFNMCVFPSWADNYTTNGVNTAADRLEEAEDVIAAGYVNQLFIRADENFEKMMELAEKYDCQFWIGASAFHSKLRTIENYLDSMEGTVNRIIAAGQWDNFLGFWWDEPVWAHNQSNEDMLTMTKALYEKWGKRNYIVYAVGAFIDNYGAECDTIAPAYTTYITDAGWDQYSQDVSDEGVAADRANPDKYKKHNEKYGTNIRDGREYYRWVQSELLEKFDHDVKVWFYPCTYMRATSTTEKYCLEHMNFFHELLMEQKNPGGLTLYTYPNWSTSALESYLPVINIKTGTQKLFPGIPKWEKFAARQKELCKLYNSIEIEENKEIPFGHLNVTEVTQTSISFQAEDGYSYSISGGSFSKANKFTNLEPYTRYTITVRRDSDKKTKNFKIVTNPDKPYVTGYNDKANFAMKIPAHIKNYSATFGYIATSLSRNIDDTDFYKNGDGKYSPDGFMPVKIVDGERFIKIVTSGGDGNAVINFAFGDQWRIKSTAGFSSGLTIKDPSAFAIRMKTTGGKDNQLSIFDFYISCIKGQKRTDNAKNFPIKYYDIKTKKVSTLTYKGGINITGNIDGWIIVPFNAYYDLDGDTSTTNLESIKAKMKEFQIWLHEGSGCKHAASKSSWADKAWYLGDILYIEGEDSFVKGRNAGFVGLPQIKDAPMSNNNNISSQIQSEISSKNESATASDSESEPDGNRRPSLSVSSKPTDDTDNEGQTTSGEEQSSGVSGSDAPQGSDNQQGGGSTEGDSNSDGDGEILYEYYIPTYVWYIVGAGVLLAAVGAVVLVVLLKKKKAAQALKALGQEDE
ncbi:MAG: hypothetical protein IJ370_05295 [Oscillospiraceae bacterium]|nr:hypothetical protein [Oscillospiraceae bacterium]